MRAKVAFCDFDIRGNGLRTESSIYLFLDAVIPSGSAVSIFVGYFFCNARSSLQAHEDLSRNDMRAGCVQLFRTFGKKVGGAQAFRRAAFDTGDMIASHLRAVTLGEGEEAISCHVLITICAEADTGCNLHDVTSEIE